MAAAKKSANLRKSILALSPVLTLILMSPANATATIYSNDFSAAENVLPTSADGFLSGPDQVYQIQIAPDGTTFLGYLDQTKPYPYNIKAAVLPLGGLALHSSVTISFDLYALFSLSGDGAHDNSGGDYFKLITADSLFDLSNAPTVLLNDSFSSGVCGGCGPGQPFQSYGGPGLSGVYPGTTGSYSHSPDAFGYCEIYGGACGGESAGEFTYKMSFTFDDSSNTVLFGFIGNAPSTDFGAITSTAFGIDNLVITTDAPTNVPEPATWSLLLAGFIFGGFTRLRPRFERCRSASYNPFGSIRLPF